MVGGYAAFDVEEACQSEKSEAAEADQLENSESESGSDDIIKQTNEFVQATEEEWESKNPGIAKEWDDAHGGDHQDKAAKPISYNEKSKTFHDSKTNEKIGSWRVITDDAGHEQISVYCNRHQCSFIAVAERCGAFNIDGLSNWFEAGLGCSKGKLGQGAHKKLWKSLVAQTR